MAEPKTALETDVEWIKNTAKEIKGLLMGCQKRCEGEMDGVYCRLHEVEDFAAQCKGAKQQKVEADGQHPQKHQAYGIYLQSGVAIMNILVLLYLAVHFGKG